MQRTAPVLAACITAMSATPAATADFSFRMSTFSGDTGIFYTCMAQPFTEHVANLSNNRVEIQLFAGGVLHEPFGGYQAITDGLVDMTHAHPVFLGSADPTNTVRAVVNPGADSVLHFVYNPEIEATWQDYRRETMDMHSLVLGVTPTEFFAHSHREIRTGADLEGVRMRMLGEWGTVFEQHYGASPIVVPGAEIFGMLERQAIDMTEFSTPSQNIALGYHEIAEYIVYPGLHARSAHFELAISGETWDSLPADLQSVVTAAARLATLECMSQVIADDLEAMAQLQTSGSNTLIELDPAFQAEAQSALIDQVTGMVEAAEADGNTWARRVLDQHVGFLENWRANAKYLAYDR